MLFFAEASAPGTPEYISQILQWGPPGVVIVLLLLGVLVTKGQYDQMKAERDKWQAAYEKERDAHDSTREALAESVKTASASLETARTTTALLTNLGHLANQPGKGSQ
jgi:hemoglobin-like flavoprotein